MGLPLKFVICFLQYCHRQCFAVLFYFVLSCFVFTYSIYISMLGKIKEERKYRDCFYSNFSILMEYITDKSNT